VGAVKVVGMIHRNFVGTGKYENMDAFKGNRASKFCTSHDKYIVYK